MSSWRRSGATAERGRPHDCLDESPGTSESPPVAPKRLSSYVRLTRCEVIQYFPGRNIYFFFPLAMGWRCGDPTKFWRQYPGEHPRFGYHMAKKCVLSSVVLRIKHKQYVRHERSSYFCQEWQ